MFLATEILAVCPIVDSLGFNSGICSRKCICDGHIYVRRDPNLAALSDTIESDPYPVSEAYAIRNS